MYAFLLVLGAVIAAAGLILAIPGLPIAGRDFDPSVITPGAVAIVGGLILIGLGLAVRVLTRIEKALAAERSTVRPALKTEVAVAAPVPAVAVPVPAIAAEQPSAPPLRMPLPPQPRPLPAAESRPQPVPAAAVTPVLPEDTVIERFREKFPSLVRADNTPAVEETDVSLSPIPPSHAEEEIVEERPVSAPQRVNGRAAARVEPRLEIQPQPRAVNRAGVRQQRNFDAFWPKQARVVGGAQPVPAQPSAPPPPVIVQSEEPVLPAEPALTPEPEQFQFQEAMAEEARVTVAPVVPMVPVAPPPAEVAPVPISILKSGVVDGMAYTLYSDGSIEAQLPQGTLRFGSIAALRTHIEQSA